MPSYPRPDDPDVVIDQLYSAFQKTLPGLDKIELSDVVADISPDTTILGASTLEVAIIDPRWVLLTSGVFDLDARNRLPKIDLNYPNVSNYWWRLTQIDVTTDLEDPNLTLTFEARVVAYERDKTGQKSWSRSRFTRAQAIKGMLGEVQSPPVPVFVSPELDERQPVEVEGG